MKLDHFAWATSSIQKGVDEFVRLGGPVAAFGGSHSGQGTCNALASLGDGIYLAIDAPDPTQDQKGTYGEVLSRLQGFDLNVFAIACEDLRPALKVMRSHGIDCEIVQKIRVRPDGVEMKSSVLETSGHSYGKAMPHFMQWHTDKHPSLTAPGGCSFVEFHVEHPEPGEIADFYHGFGLNISVKAALLPKLSLALRGSKGDFLLPSL
ncbi:MAG: VOC family protein [Alphaproteobacteria bacterium]|nr:VOC family protein [Alphaproteobacteria bacterium]